MSTLKYKGEDIVQGAMGGFSQDGKFVYGNLAITPTAMVYYDKKVEDVSPLVNVAKVEVVKGGPVFVVTLKDGREKQYRTGNAKAWVTKLEEWVERAANAPTAQPSNSTPSMSPAAQAASLHAPVMQSFQPVPKPVPVAYEAVTYDSQPPPASAQVVRPGQVQPIYPPPATAHQPQSQPQPQPQPVVEVILAGLEPRSPAGNEFRLTVHEWSQVWAVVSAMIVMAPENESISKDVAIQVLLPSTGFQVAGLDHRVAAQIIETALMQQQQKTIDIVAVTYSKIDFGVMYDDLKGISSPPFVAEKFITNCSQFLEFAKDNLGFTVTIAKPALVMKPITPAATTPSPAKREVQFCTQCGRQNTIDARFCVRCGKPLKVAY